jgi:NAD(P)-dependent dehydrogenase (short-subunit alcohol dehydrogenase family)
MYEVNDMSDWTTANIPSQTGRVAVVTGANSGIGWNTALELARAGAEVILAARDERKGQDAVLRIRQQLPQTKVRFEQLDLASLASVRAFVARVAREPKIDLLVNNAGVMSIPRRETTVDGFEKQFGTNYLGPFALTLLLLPALLRSRDPRITVVSSSAANMGPKKINFPDLQWEQTYDPWRAYCQSKLADLMFMVELSRRAKQEGMRLMVDAAHPGWARTNLQTSGPGHEAWISRFLSKFLSHDAAGGALPTLRAATTEAAQESYFQPGGLFALKGAPVLGSLPKPATDAAAAKRLWEISEVLTGVTWPRAVNA